MITDSIYSKCDPASVLGMNLFVSQHFNNCPVLCALIRSSRKMHPLPGSVTRKKTLELHAHADSAVFVPVNLGCSLRWTESGADQGPTQGQIWPIASCCLGKTFLLE